MIVITNGQYATMYYSEAQWLDAQFAEFPQGYRAFRLRTNNGNDILSTVITNLKPDGSNEAISSTAMTHEQISSLAVEEINLVN